jgi:hypothetical protein
MQELEAYDEKLNNKGPEHIDIHSFLYKSKSSMFKI